ncbi:MAG: phosphoribosylformylglycinamidine synthase [Firmicutes bacterium]|nr:phosphoribosylformylglycinamidine synthase [Bacillota bacterium]
MDYRLYVEKKPGFQVEAESLKNDLNSNLGLKIQKLRLLNVYDLLNFSPELLEKSKYWVFGDTQTDNVYLEMDLSGKVYLATEYLPGQFDQRASSAESCVMLIEPSLEIKVKSAKLLIFDDTLTKDDLLKIKKYYLNQVESREKDPSTLEYHDKAMPKPVPVLDGFTTLDRKGLLSLLSTMSLAMNEDDLKCVQDYFKSEDRDPNETELRILDTYWSDHCRHTTFNTVINTITIKESFIKKELEEALELYYSMRKDLKREKNDICLMDMALIAAKYLKKHGYLNDLEQSNEHNACSIFVDVPVDGKEEKWLLQFKNETHNHPTEIEPFGGASTCLGGAIRDPLSGRSYVYQAMRVTGAANIYESVEDTLSGKLPQRVISTKAAQGYSSYGNQIGLPATHVREIYDDQYVAKRLEVGAVVGAVKYDYVRREEPVAGDIVLMLGGRTGRDGIGGATGSSKEHNQFSIEESSSEVQKGNAPEERKIARLFRRPEAIRLIKKSNDFGAGGVSVAVGELADSLDIFLDRVKVKYKGLNATEIAISESQERMAVVIEKKDKAEFENYCQEENLEVVHVADVTDTGLLRMYYNGKECVNLKRSFIDTSGAIRYTNVTVGAIEKKDPFVRKIAGRNLEERILNNLSSPNVLSQKGLVEMFDSTVGASTVLMPFGGKYQATETQVSVQKLPTEGYTDLSSIMAYGYNPEITKWSTYHGSQYAVIEAITKIVAAGADYKNIRFSFQEYFQRMTDEISWGLPFGALLGAIKIQNDFKLPSIGGKDSMSGTFKNLHVPPMLMAFGITTVDAKNVISTEFKENGNYIYLVKHHPLQNYNPNTEELKDNFKNVHQSIEKGEVLSAYAIGFGGVSEALAKMSFGNKIGYEVQVHEEDLFNYSYGSILVESKDKLSYGQYLGKTSLDCQINGTAFSMEKLYRANTTKYASIYKDCTDSKGTLEVKTPVLKEFKYGKEPKIPTVYVPVFPGTNCNYDTIKAFKRVGARITTSVFKNLTSQDVLDSIDKMASLIADCDVLVLCEGFSLGDEPDGSAKFITNVLIQDKIKREINALIKRKGLILGICNGFQALVKSGLLPFGNLGVLNADSPSLVRNDINRHCSQMVTTRVASTNSPWLKSFTVGQTFTVPVSHGEGKFIVSMKMADELFKNGQVAFQYADYENKPTMTSPMNPNGSMRAIEGIVSGDGLILGKMSHCERYEENLFKNIYGEKEQDIFQNAMDYFQNK